jgi:uncharacterized membrane protein
LGGGPGARRPPVAVEIGAEHDGEYTTPHRQRRSHMLLWLLVLLLVIIAIGGGVALSKFLFLVLVIALILALFGVFNRSTV